MFSASKLTLVALALLSTSDMVLGRERWLERDNRPFYSRIARRRFGQEQPAVIAKLSAACPGQVCGNLAGAAITPLLAAQPECSQQDHADLIIDSSRQFDAATQANMIALAQEYRQAEKNTPPDFSTNPPAARNSVFCQKAPKNAELDGLVQAQDPANDPNLFFDPATKATVQKGSQANTAPFGGAAAAPAPVDNAGSDNAAGASSSDVATATSAADASVTSAADASATDAACPTEVTVTVTAAAQATATEAASNTSAAAPAVTSVSAVDAGAIGDFGSCSIPEIEFAAGFDGRRETSFQPADKASFNHGSAQNIDIITRSICDTLTNSCGADQTAKDTCAKATAAASAATKKEGIQADAFNAVFGITTNFAAVQAIDDQGRVVGGANAGANAGNGAAATTAAAPAATSSAAANTGNGAATGNNGAATGNGAIGDFGSCSIPEIEFATGFDGRKETSFQPTDKASFNHSSAQNVDIITQFICDTLTNSCGADQTAKDTCAKARTAASAKKGTGAAADDFNAVFGITTNFSAVAAVDNQGKVVA